MQSSLLANEAESNFSSLSSTAIECVAPVACVLGESPVWSRQTACLYWADIESQLICEFDSVSGHYRAIPLHLGVTALAPCADGQWLIASRTGLYLLDKAFRNDSFLLDVETSRPNIRFNDAVVDRQGNLWTGTLNETQLESPDGQLFRVDNRFQCEPKANDFAVANGIAFSPDGTALYVVDMFRRQVRVYAHDPASGALSDPRVFVQLFGAEGMPDGLTVDSHGGLWVCHWDGGCVSRYDATGNLTWRLPMPVSRVTRCTFGGPDLRDLYITTARFELDADVLAREPEAGGLFRVRVPWQGLDESQFDLRPGSF